MFSAGQMFLTIDIIFKANSFFFSRYTINLSMYISYTDDCLSVDSSTVTKFITQI